MIYRAQPEIRGTFLIYKVIEKYAGSQAMQGFQNLEL